MQSNFPIKSNICIGNETNFLLGNLNQEFAFNVSDIIYLSYLNSYTKISIGSGFSLIATDNSKSANNNGFGLISKIEFSTFFFRFINIKFDIGYELVGNKSYNPISIGFTYSF